ncbi:MAG: plastocyanin/azurin family copper-binding protein [Actinomycetota bacterium]
MFRFFALAAALTLIATACAAPDTASLEGETVTTSSTTTSSTTTTTAAVTTTVPADDHADDETDDHVDGAQTGGADRTIEVLMTEFAFDVDPVDVAAGETIEFVVTNAGVVPHEFRLSNGHRIEEHLASGHDDHDDGDAESDDDGHHEGGDAVLLLDAGDTSSVVVTFPEDTTIFTEVACLLPGHYEAGMSADVRYTA